jgi:sterol desaturase/sphingolipid hydroxylase (fatty acid hydroxylase superfamily)
MASIALELAIGYRRGGARYEARDTLTSLVMGVGNLAIGILTAGAVYGVLRFFHQFAPVSFGELSWGWAPWLFVVCFVIDDLRYYWYHRIMHEWRWFWSAHVVHHSSQHYNLSTALRQTWTSEIMLGFLFRVPLVLVGFDPIMLGFVGGINLIYQFWIHTELIDRMPPWFEAVFNTPSHHRVHHAVNPRYLDANYAGTLIIWDRMFGTFVPELAHDRPRYGITTQLGTFNVLRVAFHELIGMVRDAVQPGLSVGQRLSYLFRAPGWSHDGSRRTATDMKRAYVMRHPDQAGQPGLPAEAS